MLESALNLLGLKNKTLIYYEDLYDNYVRSLNQISDRTNIAKIYKIISAYNLVYSNFYPDYVEDLIEDKKIPIKSARMIYITRLIEEELDENNKNDQLIINLLEQNLKKDYWIRTQKQKKLN